MAKNYLAFYGDNYYASGGWDDFVGAYASIEEAVAEVTAKMKEGHWYKRLGKDWSHTWAHVVDVDLGDVVWRSDG